MSARVCGVFFYLGLAVPTFKILNERLVFEVGEEKAEVLNIRYVGPPLRGYEHTEPRFIGEIKNIGKRVIVGLRVELTVYGEDWHLLLNKREREVAFWLFEPDEVSPFCVLVGDAISAGAEIRSIKINLLKFKGVEPLLEVSTPLYHGLEILNQSIGCETTFVYDSRVISYYILAEMLNKGGDTTRSNTVVALFYDGGGDLIDYTQHGVFGKLGEIAPGESRIFRLDIPEGVEKYKNYIYKLRALSLAKE